MKLTHQGLSDPGLKRSNNEDAFLVDAGLGIYVVCDGVGGHSRGEVASDLCTRQLILSLQSYAERLKEVSAKVSTRELREEVRVLLEKAITDANLVLFEKSQSSPEHHGMACTLVCLLRMGTHAWVAHVGDSRAYVIRDQKWHVLTEDHRFVTELLKKGVITSRQAKEHPQRNVLVRAMGTNPIVEADYLEIEMADQDRFLLCTDGLSDYLDREDANAPFEMNLAVWPKALVDFANRSGGKDNVTAIAIQVEQDEKTAEITAPRNVPVLERFSLVGKVPIFRFLNYSETAKVMSITQEKSFKPGALLVQEGSPSTEWFILSRGRVEVQKGDARVAELEAGASFGEMGVFDSAPRSASVRALEEVVALVIPAKEVISLFKKEHYLAMKILWAEVRELNQRLRNTTEELATLKSRQDDISPFEEIT